MIEVDTADPADTDNREHIRAQLSHIARLFAQGDFHAPLVVHGENPDGVTTMSRLKSHIAYVYNSTPRGGRVTIATEHAEALDAVHEFLRFQIRAHRTGDSTTIEPRPC